MFGEDKKSAKVQKKVEFDLFSLQPDVLAKLEAYVQECIEHNEPKLEQADNPEEDADPIEKEAPEFFDLSDKENLKYPYDRQLIINKI